MAVREVPLRFKVTDPRFQRVQALFASGDDERAEEARAILRDIMDGAPATLRGRRSSSRPCSTATSSPRTAPDDEAPGEPEPQEPDATPEPPHEEEPMAKTETSDDEAPEEVKSAPKRARCSRCRKRLSPGVSVEEHLPACQGRRPAEKPDRPAAAHAPGDAGSVEYIRVAWDAVLALEPDARRALIDLLVVTVKGRA